MTAHFARGVSEHLMPVVKLDPKHGAWKRLDHFALKLYFVLVTYSLLV
jgi:hypothetical protein